MKLPLWVLALLLGIACGVGRAHAQTAALCASPSSGGCVIKAGPGALLDGYVTPNSAAGWMMTFNAIAVPSSPSSTTAGVAAGDMQDCIYVAANVTQGISVFGTPPETFSTGAVIAFSSTGCGTFTASVPLLVKGRLNQ